MKRAVALAGLVLLASPVLLAGCSPRDEAPEGEPHGEPADAGRSRPVVYTVNYPLAWMAERIAGGRIEVVFPAPPDTDPAFWRPTADDVAAYQSADLVLLNGAGYAKWIGTAFLPESRLVNTSAGFVDRYLEVEGAVTHTHGPGAEHEHGEEAFTTWLDPSLARLQAAAVRDAFVARWPAHADAFAEAFVGLDGDLVALEAELAAATRGHSLVPLVFSHPVYQYLARRYRLNGRNVHWEPDEVPGAAQWRELAQLRAEHPATRMLWEGEPQADTRDRLEELGVRSAVFDPCGNRPTEGDYLQVMRRNTENLRDLLVPPGSGRTDR